MSSNKENTKPKVLQSMQDCSPNTQTKTAYGCTPGVVGLRGWQPRQAHMFVPVSASPDGLKTVTCHSRPDTISTNVFVHGQDVTNPPELHRNTIADSPLRVRKTRENLRQGYEDIASSHHGVSPLNTVGRKVENSRPVYKTSTAASNITLADSSINTSADSAVLVKAATGQTAQTGSDDNLQAVLRPPQPTLRKRSVRRMVVSRVKDSLLSRSRSSSKPVAKAKSDTTTTSTASEQTSVEYGVVNETCEVSRSSHATSSRSSTFHSFASLVSECTNEHMLTPPKDSPEFTVGVCEEPFEKQGNFAATVKAAERSCSPSPENTPYPARRLVEPSRGDAATQVDPGILHVRLSVTPAWDALDLADEATIWAVINAEATFANGSMRPKHNAHRGPTMLPSVDIIIIVDNSPLASSSALKNMSEIIRQICRLLQSPHDRLAVFSTYCTHESVRPRTASGCQIHRFQTPNMTSMSLELERLEKSSVTESSAVTDVTEVIKEAIQSVTAAGTGTRSIRESDTQVLVISPLPQQCASILRGLVTWPVHQIRVGYYYHTPLFHDLTWQDSWCIDWNRANSMILEELFDQIRNGSRTGVLSHVRISIRSTTPCCVEKLLTPPKRSTLQPGQSITLFAKVKAPPVGYDDGTPVTSLDDLYDGLCKTLGDFKNELFRAEVRYSHSLLPRGTEMRTETSCEMLRTNRNSAWGRSVRESDKRGLELEIEKAHFIARNYPPEIAIKILHKKFGNLWLDDDHPAALYCLREELEFQEKVLAETQMQVLQTANATTSESAQDMSRSSKDNRRTTLHVSDMEASQITSSEPSRPASTDATADVPPASGEDNDQRRSVTEPDEARRIWMHMRRNSRNTSGPLDGLEKSSRDVSETQRRESQESVDRLAARDERLHEIRARALQNKRSVGAETLRDFGLMQDEMDDGACAPWL